MRKSVAIVLLAALAGCGGTKLSAVHCAWDITNQHHTVADMRVGEAAWLGGSVVLSYGVLRIWNDQEVTSEPNFWNTQVRREKQGYVLICHDRLRLYKDDDFLWYFLALPVLRVEEQPR